MYQKYMNDIFAIVEGKMGKGVEAEKRIKQGMSEVDKGGEK